LREAIEFGADKVYVADHPWLKDYQTDAYVAVMEEVCRELRPNILLFGQTSIGRDLAPRLAFRLKTRLVTDCVDLRIDSQTRLLIRTKPVYGGNAYANFVSEAKPQMATVRAKSMPVAECDASHKGEIITLKVELDSAIIRTKVVSKVQDKSGAGKRLETASVIVSGGRGIGSAQNFALLEELARLLKGAVGATRPACDLGWVPADLQIGMTGRVVAPVLYIGVALSGSSAHLAGCGNAKNVIAINKDPEANIFRVANYGIVGDFKQVLPILIDKCRQAILGSQS
jgi:electron transfer flavoprotein alpha subunit